MKMPQMYPLNWILLFFYFSILFYFMESILYFFYSISYKKEKQKVKCASKKSWVNCW